MTVSILLLCFVCFVDGFSARNGIREQRYTLKTTSELDIVGVPAQRGTSRDSHVATTLPTVVG